MKCYGSHALSECNLAYILCPHSHAYDRAREFTMVCCPELLHVARAPETLESQRIYRKPESVV